MLAIDLFCGLPKSEFFAAANMMIKQFVACGAQNPDHVSQGIGHNFPRSVPLELRFMRDFENAIFSAAFACDWQVGILSAQSAKNAILKGPSRIIDFLDVRFSAMKCAALLTRGFTSALWRTVTTICVRRHYFEMRRTTQTITANLRHIHLLATPPATSARLAGWRAIELVGTFGQKSCVAIRAKQVVHRGCLA